MHGSLIGQPVYFVHFFLRQRSGGGILYDKGMIGIGFRQPLSADRISVFLLKGKALRVQTLIGAHAFIIRQENGIVNIFPAGTLVYSPIHKSQIPDGDSGGESVRDLHNGALSHSVGNQIGPAVQKQGAFKTVGPVIIMRQPAQAGLDASQDNGRMPVDTADQIAVNDIRPVRPLPHEPAGRIGIGLSALSGYGIMVHHGIHVPGRDQKGKTRLPIYLDARRILPVRLGQNGHRIPVAFQHPSDNGRAKGWMIHIGVPDDVDKVRPFDSSAFQFFRRGRQKSGFQHGFTFSFSSGFNFR